MDYFTTQHICGLFEISHQTVKTWSRVFAAYLSPTATPQEGKRRMFISDDVRVFDLVHDYRQRGYTYDDAMMALAAGQRGNLPASVSEVTPTAPPALIVALREEIEAVQRQLNQRSIELHEANGQNKLLREWIEQKERRIAELLEEIARLKAQKP